MRSTILRLTTPRINSGKLSGRWPREELKIKSKVAKLSYLNVRSKFDKLRKYFIIYAKLR